MEEVGRQIFEKIIAVASGEQDQKRAAGHWGRRVCPWSIGPTL